MESWRQEKETKKGCGGGRGLDPELVPWRPGPEPSSMPIPDIGYQLSMGKESLTFLCFAGTCGHTLV